MDQPQQSEWTFDVEAIRGIHLATHRQQLELAVAGGLITSAEARALAEAFAQSTALENIINAEVELLTAMIEQKVR